MVFKLHLLKYCKKVAIIQIIKLTFIYHKNSSVYNLFTTG